MSLYNLGLSLGAVSAAGGGGGIPFSHTSRISLNAATKLSRNVSVEVSAFDTFDSIPNLTTLSPARSVDTWSKRPSQLPGSEGKRRNQLEMRVIQLMP